MPLIYLTSDLVLALNENSRRIGPRGRIDNGPKFEVFDEDKITHHLSVQEAFPEEFSTRTLFIPSLKTYTNSDVANVSNDSRSIFRRL